MHVCVPLHTPCRALRGGGVRCCVPHFVLCVAHWRWHKRGGAMLFASCRMLSAPCCMLHPQLCLQTLLLVHHVVRLLHLHDRGLAQRLARVHVVLIVPVPQRSLLLRTLRCNHAPLQPSQPAQALGQPTHNPPTIAQHARGVHAASRGLGRGGEVGGGGG